MRLPAPPSDGRSFLALLRGEPQTGRDHVFAQFYHIHGADALPMRSVITKETAYVFNPWSNGERLFNRNGGAALRTMQKLATSDARLAARVSHLQYRSVEEFFDLGQDPGCLTNLLGATVSLDTENDQRVQDARAKLRQWMVQVDDSALHAFDHRDDPDVLEEYLRDYREHAAKEVEALKPYEKEQGFRF